MDYRTAQIGARLVEESMEGQPSSSKDGQPKVEAGEMAVEEIDAPELVDGPRESREDASHPAKGTGMRQALCASLT